MPAVLHFVEAVNREQVRALHQVRLRAGEAEGFVLLALVVFAIDGCRRVPRDASGSIHAQYFDAV
jgi:hypothetical protein